MSVGTERQNIIILFWKLQIHFWEYINGNQTWILTSPLFPVHFLLSSYQALNPPPPPHARQVGSCYMMRRKTKREIRKCYDNLVVLEPNKTT
jgi:hypothetical protein